ncbi:MerR family transcriptional regulator [Rhizorhabdus dicambivorans]|uniref:Transcriptional regulator n=1 Tax=Rhizorhabdus dicambivorans TaxID=1850238 RepID=A0A2A4G2T0_9SPHN|nr:MerR family DNA-binding transcriptional regulator [Rhizorhabdus dicambivorans]ATE65054.1 transcriptional regulator [Rhizorhabdus dicambivorans]PCE44328.1 transcriptional regulator [Rhizorhabdus dicambivorans]
MSVDCVTAYPLAPTQAEHFGITELSREFGITPRALRFYEEEGLIAPARDGAARIYSRRDRARIAWILRGKSLGFSLDDIGEMLDLYDLGDGRATQRAVTAVRCRERAASLREQLTDIQGMIDQLSSFAESLDPRHNGPGTSRSGLA